LALISTVNAHRREKIILPQHCVTVNVLGLSNGRLVV
jgi:hypothetical protein